MKQETKTHWKKLENPDYIGAYSLDQGKDLTVIIASVKRELITGTGGKKEECTVAVLQGQKPFIVNRTNAKTISKVVGSPYIEDWAGKSITLYVASIRAFGEDNVECLRVRATAPVIVLPEITANSDLYNKALSALNMKSCDLAAIKKKYSMSDAVEQQLKQEAGL